MANKIAAWQNPEIIKAIDEWWKEEFPFNEASVNRAGANKATSFSFYHLLDLYQSYYEYMTPSNKVDYRLNQDQFAKCLMAARIMDIGGIWRQAVDWNPTPDQIRRVTGNE